MYGKNHDEMAKKNSILKTSLSEDKTKASSSSWFISTGQMQSSMVSKTVVSFSS